MTADSVTDREPPLLKVAEAAYLLRVSKMTVYRMIDDGSLASVRIGPRAVRVHREAVKHLLGDAWQPDT